MPSYFPYFPSLLQVHISTWCGGQRAFRMCSWQVTGLWIGMARGLRYLHQRVVLMGNYLLVYALYLMSHLICNNIISKRNILEENKVHNMCSIILWCFFILHFWNMKFLPLEVSDICTFTQLMSTPTHVEFFIKGLDFTTSQNTSDLRFMLNSVVTHTLQSLINCQVLTLTFS